MHLRHVHPYFFALPIDHLLRLKQYVHKFYLTYQLDHSSPTFSLVSDNLLTYISSVHASTPISLFVDSQDIINLIISMGIEKGNKMRRSDWVMAAKDKVGGLLLLLPMLVRLAAVAATVIAALVMGLNKENKSTAVAVVGTTTIFQTSTVKFQYIPAFVYFVIANAIASVYNLFVLSFRSFFKCKWYGSVELLTDMVMMALVATGAAAAASMAELGKNGNLHARWSPVCDKFGSFCNRGGVALIASFLGAFLLFILNVLSTLNLSKN